MGGNDPCDQDGRMGNWEPLELSRHEYERIKEWWGTLHPRSRESSLESSNWTEWVQEILEL